MFCLKFVEYVNVTLYLDRPLEIKVSMLNLPQDHTWGTCQVSGVGVDSAVSSWVSSVPCIDWDWTLPAGLAPGSCVMRGPPGLTPSLGQTT